MGIFGISFGCTVEMESRDVVFISGIRTMYLINFIKAKYGSGNFLQRFCIKVYPNSLRIYNFFIPELVYLINCAADEGYLPKSKATQIINLIYENTWMKSTKQEIIDTPIDLNNIKKEIIPEYKLTDTQLEFIRDTYYQKKTQYLLNGYLLSLDPGLGKTFTSLALYTALHKKHAIICCPLSIVTNVWENEIKKVFKKPKNIWSINKHDVTQISKDTDFVIINYEAIEKIIPYVKKLFNYQDTIIVVDESHNFKDYKSLRTEKLIELVTSINSTDTLLMSGTPIKALGRECIPIFKILDNFFNRFVEKELLAINRYTNIMNDLLRNRLGMMMYRKLKKDVLDLPKKHELDLKVKIPNGSNYTLENIRKLVVDYKKERRKYYKERFEQFNKDFTECLKYFEATLTTNAEKIEFKDYLRRVAIIQKKGFVVDTREDVIWCNKYEKDTIIPRLPNDLKKKFRNSKTVVKYVELKILGEVLGNLLNQLRMEMTSSMINDEVMSIIKNAEKKTILFSSYMDTIEIANQKCKKYNLKPLVITGENTKEASILLDGFKKDTSMNPLIASIKAMSTGHTILEANTVIFLNVPFRSVDYEQASDRVYRIGQDTEVFIYKLILDTGNEPNLSTRMHDIINWSKEQFDAIVGDAVDVDDDLNITNRLSIFFNNPLFMFSNTLLRDFNYLISESLNKFLSSFK